MARPRVLEDQSGPVGVAGSFRGCGFTAWAVRGLQGRRTPAVSTGGVSKVTSRGLRIRLRLAGLVSGRLTRCSVVSTCAALPNRGVSWELVARGLDDRTVVSSGEAVALEPRPVPLRLGGLALRLLESVRAERLPHLGEVSLVPAVGLSFAPVGWTACSGFRLVGRSSLAVVLTGKAARNCAEPDASPSILRHSRHRPGSGWGCSDGRAALACLAANDHCRELHNFGLQQTPSSRSLGRRS
jgi:hypothetical protein